VAHQLIEALADEWDPEKYKDTFQDNLKQLIETKLEGGEVAAVEKPKKLAPVVDLMAALKQSLAQMEGKKKPAATAPAEPVAAAAGDRGWSFRFGRAATVLSCSAFSGHPRTSFGASL
jgi:DNA end-binding protein Ku